MYITWSDLFTFVIMIVAIITLVRNDKHKKIAPSPEQCSAI